MKRLLRAPALHFLAIGAVIFVAEARWRGGRPLVAEVTRAPLIVSAAALDRLRADFRLTRGRPPAPDEDRALVEEAVNEEVLYRQALAAGFGRDNPFIRDRMLTLTKFLGEGWDPGETEVFARGQAPSLEENDLVIRRHLVETVREIARGSDAAEPVDEADLRSAYERHADRFRRPPSLRLTQVFLSRDQRGGKLDADARSLAGRLRERHVAPDDAAAFGDSFLHPPDLPALPETTLQKWFGKSFVHALAAAPEKQWIGPVESSYGLHLVWIHERLTGELPAASEVKTQLMEIIRHERGEERLQKRLTEWRRRYDLRVAGD